MNKAAVWAIVLILLIVGIVTISGNKKSALAGPVKIGFITPLSGDAASLGEFIKSVSDLAIDEINNNGGIDGQPINLVYEDDKCAAAPALSAAQKLINVDGVKIIIGSTCSSGALAMLPVAEQNNVFVFSGTATSPDLTGRSPLFARTIPSDANQGKALAETAIARKWTKIAVVQESSDYALGIFKAFENAFPVEAGTIRKEEYPSSTTDFRSILTKLKSEEVDALFLDPQSPGTADRLIRNFADMKWEVPVMINDVVGGNAELVANNKTALEGALVAEQFTDLIGQKHLDLEQKYKDKYGKEMIYKAYSQAQYDLIYILAEGLKKYGNDPEKIATWVRTIKDWDGVSGKITIGSNGDVVGGHVVRVIKDGKIVDIK